MEPVSAIGLAAGAVQCADVGGRAFLGMIKLLKDLKQTPKRMTELLQDLEKSVPRIHTLHNEAQQPSSALFSHLGATQRQRAVDCINDAFRATNDLRAAMAPLFQSYRTARSDWAKRAWRSVVSVTMEKDIAQKVNRIERVKGEMMCELQLTDLEMQSANRDISMRTLSSLEAGQRDAELKLDSLSASYQASQLVSEETRSQLEDLQPDMKLIRGSLSRIEDTVASIDLTMSLINSREAVTRSDLKTIQNEMKVDNGYKIHKIETMLGSRFSRLENDVAMLPNEILQALTRNKAIEIGCRTALLQLDTEANAILASLVGTGLMKYPASLRDAYDNPFRTNQQASGSFKLDSASGRLYCGCQSIKRRWLIRKGRFAFGHNFKADHDPKCQFHSRNRFWSYSFYIQLLPLLQKAVEFSFAASSGAGGNALGPSVRYFGVVERSKSPAFRLVDDFPSQHANINMSHRRDPPSDWYNVDMFYWNWNMNSAKLGFRDLRINMTKLFAAGLASASDKDELGNTLLHSVFLLVRFLGLRFSHVSSEVQQLADLIIDAGVDIQAVSQGLRAHDSSSSYAHKDGFGSAFSFAITTATEWPQHAGTIPLYRTILQLQDNDERVEVLRSFRRWPNLLEWFNYGELEKAIFCRQVQEMNAIIQARMCTPKSKTGYEQASYDLTPLELAIGWREGLLRLMDADFDGSLAVLISILLDEPESTRILLDMSDFPYGAHNKVTVRHSEWEEALRLALESSNPIMQQIVVQALRTRREALTKLALENFSSGKIAELGLLREGVIDSQTTYIYHMLREGGVDVSLRLSPQIKNREYGGSVYHTLQTDLLRESLMFANVLYTEGFTSVDEPDRNGKTPLLRILTSFGSSDDVLALFALINWFLDKGANTSYSSKHLVPSIMNEHGYYPTILFYLASFLQHPEHVESLEYHSLEFGQLFRRSASCCDLHSCDVCFCYCSSKGCRFLHLLFQCRLFVTIDHESCIQRDCRWLFRKVHWLLSLCELDQADVETMYEDLCRREVFDRLGIAHTCCWYNYGHLRRRQQSEDERLRLQEEDAVLKQQLDLVMLIYQRKQKMRGGFSTEFWDEWWKEVGAMLPELRNEERCSDYCLRHHYYKLCDDPREDRTTFPAFKQAIYDRRIQTEKEALDKMGYSGLDLIEVIQRHFAADLKTDPETSLASIHGSSATDEGLLFECSKSSSGESPIQILQQEEIRQSGVDLPATPARNSSVGADNQPRERRKSI